MEDASGEHIEDHARAFEADGKKLPSHEAVDQAHLDPSRWWYASAAFPMIAGTLGPVASAFSICALVRPWRQMYPPGTDVDDAAFIADPLWLTIINAIQLAIALVSNFSLLLNMTRRLRFSIAQPITIIGWYISSITLIALTATASGPLLIPPDDLYIWSQAFYYAIYSAILYFLVSLLMTVTFMGAHRRHYEKDFMLTPSQRTLMLQTIMFLMYLLVGALVFANIESWDYLDAVYWAAVTLFTVGFGDFYATTTLGRSLLIPYALVGIISLGLVIGSIRSLVLERGKHRFDARVTEKKRRNMLRRLTMKGKDGILEPINEPPRRRSSAGLSPVSNDTGLSELERREQEFKLMRRIQEDAARRRRWYSMAISASTWLVLWLVGARIFQECEESYQGWTYFEAFYFSFVSLTTIGYGDVTPVSNAGKSFWVFWALLALPTMTVLISNAGDTIVKGIRDTTDHIALITILPGERGFKKDAKLVLKTLSFGTLFSEEIEEMPAGFLGEAQRRDDLDEDDDDDDDDADDVETSMANDQKELDAEGATSSAVKEKRNEENAKDEETHAKRVEAFTEHENQQSSKQSEPSKTRSITFASRDNSPHSRAGSKRPPSSRSASPNASSQMLKMTGRTMSIPRQILPDIPNNAADYHVILIEEIGRVTQHLKNHPPRKYTFQEWAWYLKLIGEDESDAARHRKAQSFVIHSDNKKLREKLMALRNTKKNGSEGQVGDDDDEEAKVEVEHEETESKWSWVSSQSPLMGSQEEAEWILEKLTIKLSDELKKVSQMGKRTVQVQGVRRRSGEHGVLRKTATGF